MDKILLHSIIISGPVQSYSLLLILGIMLDSINYTRNYAGFLNVPVNYAGIIAKQNKTINFGL